MTLRSLRSGRRPFTTPLRAFGALVVTTLSAGIWFGCSASTDSNTFGAGGGDSSATSTASGAGGDSSTSTTTSSGEGGNVEFDAGISDANLDDDSACAATSATAEQILLDMIILLDRSGSMSGSNWTGSTDALKTFVNDPASDGINVGIAYFPINAPPDNNGCNKDHYDDLAVPIAALPGNAPALVASISGESPNGPNTPTYGALEGVLFAATAQQDAEPTHKVVVVFASDGDPNGCPGNQNTISVIAALAQSALNYNGVQTYVIAVQGATLANLDQIAAGGGTGAAFDVTANVAAFSQKMAEIRLAALGCEFVIPPPPNNEELDVDKVNVTYTPGGQGSPQTLPHADNLQDCAGLPGWYYDNNAMPTKIQLCPASCTIVQADANAVVDVLFGCTTEVN